MGVAEVQTEDALLRINSSTKELEDKLKELRGEEPSHRTDREQVTVLN